MLRPSDSEEPKYGRRRVSWQHAHPLWLEGLAIDCGSGLRRRAEPHLRRAARISRSRQSASPEGSATMADPFSIISLVVTAVKTINVAKNYVETICRAPQSVAFLSKDLAEIESLLRQIGHISQGERNNERELYPILAGPIASCETVSNELHKVINPWVKKSSGMKVWSRFAYGFKESDVLLLSTKMASCKQNLTLAVNSATL